MNDTRNSPTRLVVLIPALNEDATVAGVVEQCYQLREAYPAMEVVVVNDGSCDRTAEVAEAAGATVPSHRTNRGVGRAFRTGLDAALRRGAEIIVNVDADGQFDPAGIPQLVAPILEGKADVVYGSRFAGGEPHRVLYFWHYHGNKALTLASNALTDLNLTDMETCYKVFRAEVFRQIVIEENRFGFEPEITAKVAKLFKTQGCRIFEVGISYSGRTYAEGKKITWRDAVSAIRCILKYNLFSK